MKLQDKNTLSITIGTLAIVAFTLLACNAVGNVTPTRQEVDAITQPSIQASATAVILAPTPTSNPTQVVLGDISADVVYTLPLTVQHVTETSATLLCELSVPSEGVLLYEPTEGDVRTQQQIALDPNETRQQIVIDGLMPGVAYQAAIGLSGAGDASLVQPGFMGQSWGAISFRTTSGKEPLRVGVVGDSGFGQQATFDLAARMADSDLDFVLHTGDVVYSIEQNTDPYEAYALKYYLPFAPVLHEAPIYPVVGNHDVEQEAMYQETAFYYDAFPAFADPRFSVSSVDGLNRWYAFAYGNVQFLMLDTQTFFNEPGRAEQTAWLSERLADEHFAYSIPVFHVPPFTSGLHVSDGLAVRSEWLPLFEAAHVPLVLSGHDHNYERLVSNGITYVVSGGGSATLYDEGAAMPESVIFAHRTHFVLLDIYADRIELQSIATDGEVLDQTTIPLNG